jgi:hypothetical protein
MQDFEESQAVKIEHVIVTKNGITCEDRYDMYLDSQTNFISITPEQLLKVWEALEPLIETATRAVPINECETVDEEATTLPPLPPHILACDFMNVSGKVTRARRIKAAMMILDKPLSSNNLIAIMCHLGGDTIKVIRDELEARNAVERTRSIRGKGRVYDF